MKSNLLCLSVVVSLFCSSCGEMGGGNQRAPIVLGDSATIITETDSQYLKDDVVDIGPKAMAAGKEEEKPEPAKKEEAPQSLGSAETANKPIMESGFSMDFGGVQMVLAGLDAKERKKQNPQRQESLAYMLQSEDISSGKVVIYGAKDLTVRQRYQSKLMLKSPLGTVDLRDLGLYTSGWTNIPVSGNDAKRSFSLRSLGDLSFSPVNSNKIQNAADRELRKRRTSSRNIQNWMKEIRKVHRADDKPCEIILDNVQWQISGTDAKGVPFRRNVRVDA